jgi:hypothetical protein
MSPLKIWLLFLLFSKPNIAASSFCRKTQNNLLTLPHKKAGPKKKAARALIC